MIDVENAFDPETKSVLAFYQRPSVGFYIPLYQREYSWDSDNVEQLKDDIEKGIENLLRNDANEIRFLGTIITVVERNKRNIEPQDPHGLPDTIEKVIDGQQRLSTISVFGALLYKHLVSVNNMFNEGDEIKDEVTEIINTWKNKIIHLFSLDLIRGIPNLKPKIIRGSKDAWTKNGEIEMYYTSNLSFYLANVINYVINGGEFPKINFKDKLGKNVANLDEWLKKNVITAHVNGSSDFKSAWDIVDSVNQDNIWDHDRDHLCDIIKEKDNDPSSASYKLSCLVQLLSVCHYLLDRCCFTTIKPTNDDWAFDMFQSLNATGTPLTAIETFQPIVVKTTEDNNERYKNSRAFESFEKIKKLFKDSNTAAKKSKRASDFLTSFRIFVDGEKLENHFSKQRSWIVSLYESNTFTYEDKKRLIVSFGRYAEFYRIVWIDYKGNEGRITSIAGHPEADLASLLILYLKDSNHKMAVTVLSYFYSRVLSGEENSIDTFIQATKAITAFYTIWRSSQGNAGLDNAYRNFFKSVEKDGGQGYGWIYDRSANVTVLKDYLKEVLENHEMLSKENWLPKAKSYLNYTNSKVVSKFALFVSAHDTIVDEEYPGLMKSGSPGSSPYLNVDRWISQDLKTLEHIAPQEYSDGWDKNLYDENKHVHSIGNLTLLPGKVNTSIGNRSWATKLLYYKNLAQSDLARRQEIINTAEELGVVLSADNINILNNANYNNHIKPITRLSLDGEWALPLIEVRRDRILNLLYDKVIQWLV